MDFDARRRAYVNRPAKRNGEPCGYTWQGTTCTVVGAQSVSSATPGWCGCSLG